MLAPKPKSPEPIEIVYWGDVRGEVKNVELVRIIDDLDPSKRFKLLRLEYPYGATIVHAGKLQIPLGDGNYAPLEDARIPAHVREMLAYSTIPLGLLLDKDSEVFVTINQRIAPLNVLRTGQLFGLFETLSTISKSPEALPVWSVFAGARSAFMVPKITDTVSHRRLRSEFGLSMDPPKNPLDHYNIFAAINQCQPLERRWYSRILLFSNDWFQNHCQDLAWLSFQNYLFKLGWAQTKFNFDDTSRQMLWEALASAIAARRLKPRPYLIDTVKHLISISMGAVPGFQIADERETLLPTQCIEEAYLDIYDLDYLPILIYPRILRDDYRRTHAYYFMTLPTLIEGCPTQRGTPSFIMDLRDIKNIIETPGSSIKIQNRFHLFDIMNHAHYTYFHPELDQLGEIRPTSEITQDDEQLSHYIQKYKNKSFPLNTPLMCGCIKIRGISG